MHHGYARDDGRRGRGHGSWPRAGATTKRACRWSAGWRCRAQWGCAASRWAASCSMVRVGVWHEGDRERRASARRRDVDAVRANRAAVRGAERAGADRADRRERPERAAALAQAERLLADGLHRSRPPRLPCARSTSRWKRSGGTRRTAPRGRRSRRMRERNRWRGRSARGAWASARRGRAGRRRSRRARGVQARRDPLRLRFSGPADRARARGACLNSVAERTGGASNRARRRASLR